ncbi:sperm-associated antigen 4 protein-like [Sarcoramphus papa]
MTRGSVARRDPHKVLGAGPASGLPLGGDQEVPDVGENYFAPPKMQEGWGGMWYFPPKNLGGPGASTIAQQLWPLPKGFLDAGPLAIPRLTDWGRFCQSDLAALCRGSVCARVGGSRVAPGELRGSPRPAQPWNMNALLAEQTQQLQLLVEAVAQLRAEISSAKKEANQAVSETASEVYVQMSDWALKSSGATIDLQRTSETYDCKENWGCRVLWFFRTANPPDTILQPDVSPENCWPLQGHEGQVVIRLPARVHLTAVTVQHISKEASPSGTVISAPRDIAVFGVDADGEEETLLGMFMYDVAEEAIQIFPLKNAPLPRAFSYIKLLVKSNWGNPAYTCIYRVQVHGKMAKPESLN